MQGKQIHFRLIVALPLFFLMLSTGLEKEVLASEPGPGASCPVVPLSTSWDNRFKRLVTEGTFCGSRGEPMRYKRYEHVGRDDAYIIFLHGRGGYIERYEALFTSLNGYPGPDVPIEETLADLPVTFFAFDQTGFGKSSGLPGHIDDFDTYVEDLKAFIDSTRVLKRHRAPIYLMSHSMGGLVTALFAQRYPEYVDGLIFSSPAWGIKEPPGLPEGALLSILEFYTQAGLSKLCSSPEGVALETLAAIAFCHADPTLYACFNDPSDPFCGALTKCLIYGYPNDCGLPPIDFAGLNAAFQYLYTLEDGCQTGRDPIPSCTFGGPDFAGTTTDFDYCVWSESNELAGVNPTVGWLMAGSVGNDALDLQTEVPILLLSTPIDPIVPYETHVNVCNSLPNCQLELFSPNPDQGIYFFHQLLLETHRSDVISKIRDFIVELSL